MKCLKNSTLTGLRAFIIDRGPLRDAESELVNEARGGLASSDRANSGG